MNKTKIMITTVNNVDYIYYSVHEINELLNMYVREDAIPLKTDFWTFCDDRGVWASVRASEIQAVMFLEVNNE